MLQTEGQATASGINNISLILYRTLTRTKARTVHVFVMVVHVQVTMQYNI